MSIEKWSHGVYSNSERGISINVHNTPRQNESTYGGTP